jgi:4-amino-4-deoxy-L-arabinose transferase-like glycosyltransferase
MQGSARSGRMIGTTRPGELGATGRPRRWDRALPAMLAALVLLGAVVRIGHLDVAARSPDERIYAAQARMALEHGLAGTRHVVRMHQQDPRLWPFPPPTRIGYSYALAAAMKLTGAADATAGSWLSCLASVLTLLVTLWAGLRFLGRWPTVAAVLFLAVFPPELVIARRCWTDAPVELAGLVMLIMACEIWSGTKGPRAAVWLPLVGSAAFLIKETTVLVYAACLVAALWATLRRRDLRAGTVLVGVAALGALGAAGLLALCTGDIRTAVQLITDQARHNAANPYALGSCSGPGYLLLLAFWKLSPLTLVLALASLVATLGRSRIARPAWLRSHLRDDRATVLLAWLTVGNTAIYMLIPHWLNLRYASASFAPMCLFAGVGVYELFFLLKEKSSGGAFRWALIAGTAVVLVSAATDYLRFTTAWLRPGAMDLAVRTVFRVMGH